MIIGTLKTIFVQKSSDNYMNILSVRSRLFSERKFRFIFILSSILYFVFFGFLTNMFIIFNADGTVYSLIPLSGSTNGDHDHTMHGNNNSNSDVNSVSIRHKGKNINQSETMETHQSHVQNHEQNDGLYTEKTDLIPLPKTHYPDFRFIICCNNFGYMPMLIIYATSTFSFLLIPLNLFLGVLISMLVGINISLNIFAIKGIRIKAKSISRGRILSGLGVSTGLLVGCPTCAGSLLYSAIGFSSIITFSSLSLYQMIFIVTSIPILIGSITFMFRILNTAQCKFPT